MGRIYASSDWHGNLELANKIFDYLKPDDTLYFLGDAADRGENGVKVLKALMNDNRVIFIKGNHDQTLLEYLYTQLECFGASFNYELWDYNGGKTTRKELNVIPEEEKRDIYIFLENLPTEKIYESPKGHKVILEHSGYTPFDIPHYSHDPLWDRSHFYDNWNYCPTTDEVKNTYLVHGHTPVFEMEFRFGYNGEQAHDLEWIKNKQLYYENKLPFPPKVIRYCEGHKFNIDLGCFYTNRGVLLDLDTFEEIYFNLEKK